MNRKIALSTLCLLPLVSYTTIAADIKPEFTASAELGFLYQTGDTKSADVKAGFNFKHEKAKWSTSVAFNILAKKLETKDDTTGNKEFESTANKWDISAQTNYTIGEAGKNYLYGNLAHEQDKFSGFESQSSLSAGWGRHWYETKTSSFFADIGPGIKHDVTLEGESNTNLIVQAQALYQHKFNEHVNFKQSFIARQATKSGDNSAYKSETSVTAKLIDALQLKFAIRVDYDTEVASGSENTNSETSMTLIYSF